MSDTQIDIDRTEDKYILDKKDFPEVQQKVETHLNPYYPEPDTIYVLNTSIYFDSPDFTFLKQHLNKIEDRRKVRIRTYAPNGVSEEIYFIEIKSKSDGKSIKTRLQINKDGFDYIMKNNKIDINNSLLDANMEMSHDEVLKQAKYINYIMLINKVEPVCKIVYKRNAYQKDESLRVTMDQNIRVTPLKLIKPSIIQDLQNQDIWENLKECGEKFYNQDNFLLEVKYSKNVPDWFNKMVEKYNSEPEAFSKYVWAMWSIMTNTLKLSK